MHESLGLTKPNNDKRQSHRERVRPSPKTIYTFEFSIGNWIHLILSTVKVENTKFITRGGGVQESEKSEGIVDIKRAAEGKER